MLEFNKLIKRCSIYLLILLPIVVVLAYILSLVNLSPIINVIICTVVGGLLCLCFETVRHIIENKKAEKNKNKPPKQDLFAD